MPTFHYKLATAQAQTAVIRKLIPRGLNSALGRSGLGTAGFAIGSYGTVAWAVYEIVSAIGGEE